jgi:RNA polymerase sigma-70 factor (ECF subfamily)
MTGVVRTEFEQFWTETVGKVRAYMFCACANWADADDLSQECYLRALRGWGQFDGKGSRKAWLFVIAYRTRADWFRRDRKKETVRLEDINEPGVDSCKDQTENIWETLKSIKDEQNEVIHMRFAVGLSYDEMAKALGIPVGTVRSRLHRGLKAIRKKIKEQENGT